jgi:long-chain acyl-CoA synthetase
VVDYPSGMTAFLPSTRENPSDIAVWAENGTRTWDEVESKARRIAQALTQLGLRKDDRWAILAHNCVEWPELFLGNVLAGTRYVPLNWHLTVPELEYLITNSGASLIVLDQSNEENGRAAAASAGIDPARVFVLGSAFDQWVDSHSDAPLDNNISGSPLMYTGGTTGASKGVVRADQGLPLENWATAASMWGQWLHMPESGTTLITTPLYHAFGAAVLQTSLARRHKLILHARFDAEKFMDTVATEHVTSAPLVPTLMIRLAKLDAAEFTRHDTTSLQWICHTAAPCPAWAKQVLIDRLGPIVVEFYGSSEGTGPVICTSQEWMDRPGTVGRPNPNLTISVVDADGNDLPTGEIGTLYFHRADGAPRYHGDDEKTQASRLPDGRFTVGDVGYLDSDGFMYLVDRRVDLILSGGVNVYPAEIEATLSRHPSIRDVAVIGIPHEELGQVVKAVVELEPGALLSAQELIDWTKDKLAGFKRPREVEFTAALPREAHGKLKKRLLR